MWNLRQSLFDARNKQSSNVLFLICDAYWNLGLGLPNSHSEYR